jgi:hypothetical protein
MVSREVVRSCLNLILEKRFSEAKLIIAENFENTKS